MARFGQAFIQGLTNPGYSQGMFNLGQTIGSAPAINAQNQQQSKAMELVNSAIASNDPQQLIQAAQAMRNIDPAMAAKLAGLAQQATAAQNNLVVKQDAAKASRGIQGGLAAISQAAARGVPLEQLSEGTRSVIAQGGTNADILEAYNKGKEKTNVDKRSSFGSDIQVRDAKGNLYTATSVRNKDTGVVETAYSPITPNAPRTPEGGVSIVSGTTGAGAFDKPGIEGDVTQSKKFADLQVQAATELPNLISEKQNINDAITALDSINTGGIPANVENFIRKNTGVQDPNAADYEVLVGEAMFQRLKPLFGGVISEGEREAVMSLYADLKRGNPANKRILQRMAGLVNDSITRSNLLRNSTSFDEYNMKLDKFFPDGSSFEKSPEDKKAPAAVGRWNPETGTVEFYNAPVN